MRLERPLVVRRKCAVKGTVFAKAAFAVERDGDLPSRSGVYWVVHERRQFVYVGSSLRLGDRRRYWMEAIASYDGPIRPRMPGCRAPRNSPSQFGLSERFMKALREAGSAGWRFEVVEFFPDDVPALTLWEAERREIAYAMSHFGERCLNAGARPPVYFTTYDGRSGVGDGVRR